MIRSLRTRSDRRSSAALVDIAPLIDVLFILLVFFLVTSNFVRDSGIEVERPEARSGSRLSSPHLRISIAPGGAVHSEGERLSLEELRHKVRDFVAREAEHAILIIPDRRISAERLVEVMDAAKLGGAQNLSVATRRPR